MQTTLNVKMIRKKLGLSRADFAKKLGATRGMVYKWEERGVIPSTPYALDIIEMDACVYNMARRMVKGDV